MRALVGYTGFVGSNIYAAGEFDAAYNSKNIADAYGTDPELLIYAGLRAEKYLANHTPEKDQALIFQAEDNIRRINPKQLILISTIDIFKTPKDVDETSEIDTVGLHPYGYNRYQLELWVRDRYPDALIIRLPGLFGKNIKKNFIYDYIHRIPFMLTEAKFNELVKVDPKIKKYYHYQDNGFFKVDVVDKERTKLKEILQKMGFSSLHFTDSRSSYQFYNLENLWGDIQVALKAGIRLLHLATEPVSVSELYEYLAEEKFVNEITDTPADYNYKTVYDMIFGGKEGYVKNKRQVLKDVREFVEREILCEME